MARGLSAPEYNAVVAGLRAVQNLMDKGQISIDDLESILTNDGTQPMPAADEIDKLVDSLQFNEIMLYRKRGIS